MTIYSPAEWRCLDDVIMLHVHLIFKISLLPGNLIYFNFGGLNQDNQNYIFLKNFDNGQ